MTGRFRQLRSPVSLPSLICILSGSLLIYHYDETSLALLCFSSIIIQIFAQREKNKVFSRHRHDFWVAYDGLLDDSNGCGALKGSTSAKGTPGLKSVMEPDYTAEGIRWRHPAVQVQFMRIAAPQTPGGGGVWAIMFESYTRLP
jgi:hypothetical protein